MKKIAIISFVFAVVVANTNAVMANVECFDKEFNECIDCMGGPEAKDAALCD